MAPEEIQDLVQDFTAKATAVNAVVQELPNMAAALQYVVDVCENKAPCELMADEDVEKGPNGPNGVPTRVQRIVAAPVLNDEDFAKPPARKRASCASVKGCATIWPVSTWV